MAYHFAVAVVVGAKKTDDSTPRNTWHIPDPVSTRPGRLETSRRPRSRTRIRSPPKIRN